MGENYAEKERIKAYSFNRARAVEKSDMNKQKKHEAVDTTVPIKKKIRGSSSFLNSRANYSTDKSKTNYPAPG